MSTITQPKVYELSTIPPEPHQRMFLPELFIGKLLWLHSSRRSSVGGYIGTFSETYRHGNRISPKSGEFQMLMEYVNPCQEFHHQPQEQQPCKPATEF